MIENSMPLLGEAFPEFEAQTTHGKKNIPGDYKGKWLVLFSHPADFTPVCTTEFVGFQERYKDFQALNTELVGLSIDQVFSHIKWTQWINEKLNIKIEYPIVAANDSLAAKLGMLHPGKGSNTVRAVFVIDPKGVTRQVLYYPQELGRNIDEIVRSVKAIQISDTNGVAMPANWPQNSLIQDKVIVPPATDEKTAEERKTQYENFDWWFAYKKL